MNWHTPDEMKPADKTDIVVLGPLGFDGFRWYICEDREGRYHYEDWVKWAYLDDVIHSLDATSKALDVARCLLRNIELFGDDDGDRAREALQEIDKIMKGGK